MSQRVPHEVPAAHVVSAVLQSDALLIHLQRELYRMLPGITVEQLRHLLRNEILRREMIESSHANEAQTLINRMEQLRAQGLSMTQTMHIVTGEGKVPSAKQDETYHILYDDKRYAGGGG